jgi:hypothetical protein
MFDVTERLRGNIGRQVEIYEPGTSCDYPFKAGKSYLVFAHPENGRLMTSELSATQAASTASAVLRQLRALSEGRKLASLFGMLSQHSGPNIEEPIAGVMIEALSNDGTFTARSESDGSFEFAVRPPGQYRVKAEVPKAFVPVETRALVKRGESCDAQSLWTLPDGRIRGRVVDSRMQPVPGFLSVFPADADERASLMGYDVAKRGHFDIGPLPPGRYRLAFRAKAIPNERLGYPTTTSETYSSPIDLGKGQHIDDVTFTLR